MIGNWIFVCLFGISQTVAREAIIGGDQAAENQFPYHVSVVVGGRDECAGGIISDRFILTAAHCVIDDNGRFVKDRVLILAGTNNLRHTDAPAVRLPVKKIYVPSEYQPQDVNSPGDIAVLKLISRLTLSKSIKRLRMPKKNYRNYEGQSAIITGFGWDWVKLVKHREVGGNSDDILRFAQVQVIGECNKNYHLLTLEDTQICARIKDDDRFKSRGVCTGDSGSPLVYDGKAIIGVLSVSPQRCSEKEKGAIYTRVSRYLDFIQAAMHDKNTKDIRFRIVW